MTRKTIPGVGVIFPSDYSNYAGFIAPTIPRVTAFGETSEDQVVESPCSQVTESSPGIGAGRPSLSFLRIIRSFSDSTSESVLTPTSSKVDSFSFCRKDNSPPPPFTCWINTCIAVDQSSMPPEFNINQYPPFLDPLENLGVQRYDVIKIRNVPFSVTVAEVKSFVGRLTSSPLIKDHIQGYPVHIIMERPTGKTMDCYVEFQNKGAGKSAVLRAEQIQFEGKALKIGSRHVDVEASCEGELCAALFPRAKSVLWDRETGVPDVLINDDPYSEGFQGFFTVEEITSVCKHAATPQKSTFNQRCQQRVYESMISTMYKFPWHIPQHYSVNARNFLWSAYIELLHNLVARVLPSESQSLYGQFEKEVGLSHNLLMEYVFAGLNVQMFSLRQKFMVVEASGSVGTGFMIPPEAVGWPFQTLVPPPNCPSKVLNHWLYILDVGYEKCILHGIAHGYENFMQINRDELSYLKVELNDAGRAMNFASLISMEKSLMQMLVDHGRNELCKAWNIPYQPLNWSSHASSTVKTSRFRGTAGAIQRFHVVRDDGGHKFGEEDDYGPLVPNDPDQYVLSDDEDGNAKRSTSLKPHNGSTTYELARPSSFNPTTPSFVPSQPWAGGSVSARRGTTQPASTVSQAQAGMHNLSLAMASSGMSAQEVPTTRPIDVIRTLPPVKTQQVGSVGEAAPYDPFSGDISTPAFRRSFVQSYPRSASGSSMKLGIRDTSSGRVASDASGHSDTHSSRHGVDNIWEFPLPGEPPKALPITRVSPRRAVSAESATTHGGFIAGLGIKSDNALQTQWIPGSLTSNSASPAELGPFATSDTQFGASTMGTVSRTKPAFAYPVTPLNQFQSAAPNELSRTWNYDSPTRGLRSRSSTSRNAFRIQATIDEEADMIASETVDEVDDAAGGVSLRG